MYNYAYKHINIYIYIYAGVHFFKYPFFGLT